MDTIQQRKRPFVLGMFALILWGQAFVLPLLLFLFLVVPANSPVNVNGIDVPMGQIRLESLGTMLIWFGFAAFVGPGLWKGNPIARHVAFGMYVAVPIAVIVAFQRWAEIPWTIICYLIVGGYLYAKPNVRAFFESYEPS